MKAPLVWVAFFLAAGILAAEACPIPLILTISTAVFFILLSLFTMRRKIASFITLSAAFFFIGFLLFQIKEIYPDNHIVNFTPREPQSVYIEGLIMDEPNFSRTSYGEAKVNFILKASGFQRDDVKRKITGKVKVFISGDREPLNYGDSVLINGLLSHPIGPGNPGEYDYARYLRRNGVFSVLSAKGHNVVLLEKGGGVPIFRVANSVRKRITKLIYSYLPHESANFMSAILLGQRQEVDFELNDIFMKTGTVHLLAISGLNVGLLAFLVILIFRISRLPRKISIIATIAFLIFYAVLTNGRPSVIRATVMAIVILFGWLIGRESSMWNSLGLAGIIILSLEPGALFDVGFQLSFISVASILYVTPKLEGLFYYDRKLSAPFMGKGKRYFIEAAFVSAAAWLGVLPFVLYHFNIVTPVATIANLIAVPLSFLITASGIPFIIFGFFAPLIAKIFAGTTWLFCIALFAITDILSKAPFGHLYFPKPTAFFIYSYYIFIVALIEHKRFKISVGKIAVIGLLLINIAVWQGALKPHDGKLRVTFLDVGHGDSVFVEFPNGGNMLIDAGKGGDFDVGRNIILPFLRNKGIHTIDAVALTHPDADHVGGLISVIKGINIRRIFENGLKSDSDVYHNFEDAISGNATKRDVLKVGDSILAGKTDIVSLNPPSAWVNNPTVEDNDTSLVLKIIYGNIALLFCADIEERAINDILKFDKLLNAELIMLPHHGEKLTLAGQALIEEVSPKYAVISQGRSSKELLRSKDTEEFLSAKGISVFRTNRDGAVFVVTDGKSIFIDNFKRY